MVEGEPAQHRDEGATVHGDVVDGIRLEEAAHVGGRHPAPEAGGERGDAVLTVDLPDGDRHRGARPGGRKHIVPVGGDRRDQRGREHGRPIRGRVDGEVAFAGDDDNVPVGRPILGGILAEEGPGRVVVAVTGRAGPNEPAHDLFGSGTGRRPRVGHPDPRDVLPAHVKAGVNRAVTADAGAAGGPERGNEHQQRRHE